MWAVYCLRYQLEKKRLYIDLPRTVPVYPPRTCVRANDEGKAGFGRFGMQPSLHAHCNEALHNNQNPALLKLDKSVSQATRPVEMSSLMSRERGLRQFFRDPGFTKRSWVLGGEFPRPESLLIFPCACRKEAANQNVLLVPDIWIMFNLLWYAC